MQLNLSNEERAAVMSALDVSYKELRGEIANTDSYEMRESLKHTEMVLAGVLEKLEPGWAANHGVQLLPGGQHRKP